jgi:hypothetical protein
MGKPIYCVIIPLESGGPEHPIAPEPPGYPDQGLPPPGVGIWPRPPYPGQGLPPSFPGRPGHGLPLPGLPVDPGWGVGLPSHPGHLPSIPPGFPGHLPSIPGAPDQGLPPGVQPPIWLPGDGEGEEVQPPGTVWPPISGVPKPENGFILAYIPGLGYKYIKVSLKPDQGLPPEAQPKR